MLGTDPSQPIPSAVELLQHPWFPSNTDDQDTETPMPLAPGQKVAVGPPAKPEHVPTGLPPTVPKMGGTGKSNGLSGSNAGAGFGGSQTLSASNGEDDPSAFVEMPDGSKALTAWLSKRTDMRNAIGRKAPW